MTAFLISPLPVSDATPFDPNLKGRHPVTNDRSKRLVLVATLVANLMVSPGCSSQESTATAAADTGSRVIADSVEQFSNQQGAKGWSYGFWDQSSDQDYHQETDFQLLKHFGDDRKNGLSGRSEFTTGKLWYLEDGQFFTSLWAEGGHANSPMKLGNYAAAKHWAVRRWVSSTTSSCTVRGRIGKVMPWGKNWTGHCRARIIVDGKEMFSEIMDEDGQDYSVEVDLKQGSLVDFLIGPEQGIGVMLFTARIENQAGPKH